MSTNPAIRNPLRLGTSRPILAITYSDGVRAASVLRRLATELMHRDIHCCGFVQLDEPRDDRARCDMVLIDLASRQRLRISEDRGPLARGCLLDAGELVRAVEHMRGRLDQGADVLIINKFGKTEVEGGGFRSLISDAMERNVVVVIAVPWRNIESWRMFAGDLAEEVAAEAVADGDDIGLAGRLGLSIPEGGTTPGLLQLD